MNKKVAVIFNTDQLGGAEKSLIEQLKIQIRKQEFTIYIPNLNSNKSPLADELRRCGLNDIKSFQYPLFLYSVSREKRANLFKLLFFAPALIYYLLHWNEIFKNYSTFYANGNKASVPILIWANIFRAKCKLLWHFRDYPERGYFKLIQKYLSIANKFHKNFEVKIIANSYSVAEEIKKVFPWLPVQVVYNLAGDMPRKPSGGEVKTIGVVAMHAAWKGLHSVVLMSKLYEKELRNIGIERIIFFGSNIYQTDQGSNDYSRDLLNLTKKLNCSLVEWGGHVSPDKIYQKIDLLIHPSLKPEPFGRIVLEAFLSGVPVISTSLGGSSELLKESECGLKYILHDYRGLFDSIEGLTLYKENRLRLEKSAYQHAREIENQALEAIDRIFL
ncbi:MAG: glycosyltransferase family 4 protein [Bacteriovoracaceae bacterium]|nr:glycosyltransferase family 4 protein [Bacteriovoracaceae bacterium]